LGKKIIVRPIGMLSMHSKCFDFFLCGGRRRVKNFFGEGKEKNIVQHAK